jgi:hypothetical protein
VIASNITIVELGGLKRTLNLVGPSLPFRGTKWGGETRLKTKFPAGNPEAVQHIVGPALAPTQFEGMWRTTQLIGTPASYIDESKNGIIITRANTLADVLESFAIAGSLLRVTWASDDGRQILREGRIGPHEFAYDRFDDVKWSCTFQWIGRGSNQSKIVQFKNEAEEAGVVAALHDLVDVLNAITSDPIRSSDPDNDLSADDDSLGDLESLSAGYSFDALASGVDASISVGFGFGASASFGIGANAGFGAGVSATASFGASAGGAGFMAGITASASVTVAGVQASVSAAAAFEADPNEFAFEAEAVGVTSTLQLDATLTLFGQTPPELLAAKPTPSTVVAAAAYAWRTQQKVHKAAKAAIGVRNAARRRRAASDVSNSRNDRAGATDAVTMHMAHGGETYAGLSLRYYSTPDRASVIASANGDPSFRIAPTPGKRLIIPALAGSDSSTRHA